MIKVEKQFENEQTLSEASSPTLYFGFIAVKRPDILLSADLPKYTKRHT